MLCFLSLSDRHLSGILSSALRVVFASSTCTESRIRIGAPMLDNVPCACAGLKYMNASACTCQFIYGVTLGP